MSQAPSMPMFWDAYLADTTHLTTEEHGAYLLLLAAMWRRNGWVPDEDKDNARILGLTVSKWKRIKERLRSFLTFEGGRISQKNLLKIWKNTKEKIDQNRENGLKGGRPTSNKNNDIGKANGSIPVNPNETIPEPEPEPEQQQRRAGAPVAAVSDEPKDRERLLSAMGADPISGLIGPNGTRLGTQADMAEAAKWRDQCSLTVSEQCAVIAEMVSGRKAKVPSFLPRSFSYFTPAMADLAARKAQPVPSGNAGNATERDAMMAKLKRLGKAS